MLSKLGPKRTHSPRCPVGILRTSGPAQGTTTIFHSTTTSPTRTSLVFNNYSPMPCSTTKTNGLLRFEYSAPSFYYECLTNTFSDPLVFRNATPTAIIDNTIDEITKQFGKTYPWALGSGRDLPNAYVQPKGKNSFDLAVQSSASYRHLSDPC